MFERKGLGRTNCNSKNSFFSFLIFFTYRRAAAAALSFIHQAKSPPALRTALGNLKKRKKKNFERSFSFFVS
jgi:hypothetical protein